MIKINLLGNTSSGTDSVRLLLAGYVVSVVLLIGMFVWVYTSVGKRIESLTQEKSLLDSQLQKLRVTTAKVRDLEKKRAELSDKLHVIANLKRSKVGPVRILDDLNIAIPEKAWLVEVKETAKLMKIIGMALDDQTVALFMKDLESSDYFETVQLVETKRTQMSGVRIKSFVLQAKINYIGKNKAAEVVSDTEDKGSKA